MERPEADWTPEQRFNGIVHILTKGLLRLHHALAENTPNINKPGNRSQKPEFGRKKPEN